MMKIFIVIKHYNTIETMIESVWTEEKYAKAAIKFYQSMDADGSWSIVERHTNLIMSIEGTH